MGRRRGRATLTGHEAEVLDLVAEGMANQQIARRLGISERTVKTHLTSRVPTPRRHRPRPGRAVGAATPAAAEPLPGLTAESPHADGRRRRGDARRDRVRVRTDAGRPRREPRRHRCGECDGRRDRSAPPTSAAPIVTTVTPVATVATVATSVVDAVVPEGFEQVAATITAADGTVCELCLWLAATGEQRSQGLMFVTDPRRGRRHGVPVRVAPLRHLLDEEHARCRCRSRSTAPTARTSTRSTWLRARPTRAPGTPRPTASSSRSRRTRVPSPTSPSRPAAPSP